METAYGQQYAELYRRHWWWRARQSALLRVLESLALPAGTEILDVGCGDGLFFAELERFGPTRGIEVDEALLDDEKPHRDRIFTRPLGDSIYDGWRFGLITALDVLEHIEDDSAAVACMAAMLEPGGYLVVTVPAFMSLWDEHDVANEHCRRYTRAEIRALLQAVGHVREARYWFHGLYIPKRIVAALNRRRAGTIAQHRIPPAPINSLMRLYCWLETRLLAPLRLPFGTSVMAVVQKRP